MEPGQSRLEVGSELEVESEPEVESELEVLRWVLRILAAGRGGGGCNKRGNSSCMRSEVRINRFSHRRIGVQDNRCPLGYLG